MHPSDMSEDAAVHISLLLLSTFFPNNTGRLGRTTEFESMIQHCASDFMIFVISRENASYDNFHVTTLIFEAISGVFFFENSC